MTSHNYEQAHRPGRLPAAPYVFAAVTQSPHGRSRMGRTTSGERTP